MNCLCELDLPPSGPSVVTGTAWGMESGVPSVADFDGGRYASLAELVDPAALYAQLRAIYGSELDAAVYERRDEGDVERRLAHQFSALHNAPVDAPRSQDEA